MEDNRFSKKEIKAIKYLQIIIMLLFIGIAGLGTYALLNKENKEEMQTVIEEEEELIPISSDNVIYIVNIEKESIEKDLTIGSAFINRLNAISGGTINTSKSFKECMYKKDVTYTEKMPLECKENMLWLYLVDYVLVSAEEEGGNVFYAPEIVAKAWNNLFGLEDKYPLAGKTVNGLKYDKDGSVTMQPSSRFEGSIITKDEIVNVEEKDDEIFIYYDVKFVESITGTSATYYSDYKETIQVEENSEKKANYKKTFKKDIYGNYYFYSIEKIK